MQNQEALLDYLRIVCRGRENAQTGEMIARAFNTTKRQIQKEIEQLRKEHPILSSDSGTMGYYYPTADDIAEAKRNLATMRRRALNTLRTARAIRKNIDAQFGNQLNLELKEAS